MTTKLTFHCLPLVSSMVAHDDDAQAFIEKNAGQFVTVETPKVQRSPQHNRLFWAVANKAFNHLPEKYADSWVTPHDMVKGLQCAFGIVDYVNKPVKGGWEVVGVPKSLDFGNMDQAEFNDVSDKLFKGMAHCLGIPVDDLLKEERNS